MEYINAFVFNLFTITHQSHCDYSRDMCPSTEEISRIYLSQQVINYILSSHLQVGYIKFSPRQYRVGLSNLI